MVGLHMITAKKYKGYPGRNPKTWEIVRVKPKKLPFFKCGGDLNERINKKSYIQIENTSQPRSPHYRH
ncbi:MAG: HU family DNA-binding protein [Desulfobacterales bacterium]|nr:HU family DNA-binding protein [Desulfobacterales bacterium]